MPPENWAPSPADRAFAAEHAPGVDADRFARIFIESCRSHGYRYVDHSAAFRTWLLNRWEKSDAIRHRRTPYQPPDRSQRDRPFGRRQCDQRPHMLPTAIQRLLPSTLLAGGHA